MIASKKDHKLSSFSTKRVLPKIQHKKVAVTPRTLPSDSKAQDTVNDNKVNAVHSKVTHQSTSVVYSPSSYADDPNSLQDNNTSVDGDTQLAIDALRSQSDTSILYQYSSHPHSAHRKSPSAKYNLCATQQVLLC